MRIQEDLVTLAAERRLIPFIGAGFSASLGLPSWEAMLRNVCDTADGTLPFDDLMAATNNDLLQVAEYLYLRHDRQIGPIRHQIERSFSSGTREPEKSAPHVELVNLHASQIYTTNYDDMIEQTYRRLGLQVNPVILPKDVALADQDRTQVVKYHGDLAHERTLVLTESAYYKRLDLESPMDLKFRSDLLGKSVLFMGYSFRDINIRIIWFKLMDMMRDIPEADRRPSYIVRFEPSPVLEELYSAVGLKTIVLNPKATFADDAERTRLLGDFLLSLSIRAEGAASSKRGATTSPFVSQALLDAALERYPGDLPNTRGIGSRFRLALGTDDPVIKRMVAGVVPTALQGAWEIVFSQLLSHMQFSRDALEAAGRVSDKRVLAKFVIGTLQQNGTEDARREKQELLKSNVPWGEVWESTLPLSDVESILHGFTAELRYQAVDGADEDIAYFADLANRIVKGKLLYRGTTEKEQSDADFLVDRAEELLKAASRIYPSVLNLELTDGAPSLGDVLAEVAAREANFEPIGPQDLDILGLGIGSSGRNTTVRRVAAGPRPARPRPTASTPEG